MINYIFDSSTLAMERRRSGFAPADPLTASLLPSLSPSDLSVSCQARLGEVIARSIDLPSNLSGFRSILRARYSGYVNVRTTGVSSRTQPKASQPDG